MRRIRMSRLSLLRSGVLAAAILSTLSCAGTEPRRTVILAINDVYRIEGVPDEQGRGMIGGLARLRTLRAELEKEHPDLILMHAGDFLFPSLMSRMYQGAQMIDVLNWLDGDGPAFDGRMLITLGNHEFEKDDPKLLEDRIRESRFTWLASDLTFRTPDGQPALSADNLSKSAILESGGLKVGVFSLTTDMVDLDFVEFADPVETARRMTAELRSQGAEVVVALTHLAISQDEEILRRLKDQGPDLILGGHEHSRQEKQVEGRWVLKADADAISATIVNLVSDSGGQLGITHEFRQLGPESPPADPAVDRIVQDWHQRHHDRYCQEVQLPSQCLNAAVGVSQSLLVGEETEIRRFETSLGNWIADAARSALEPHGAQVALIGAGNLRLNQNIPAGATVTQRHMVETFQYPSKLKLLRINGATLQKVLSRSVEVWSGNGWFLQVSGVAFRHDPVNQSISSLTLLSPAGPRPIRPDEDLLVVANDYVADGNDGYTMLGADVQVAGTPQPDLRQLVERLLNEAGEAGIAAEVEGRICNSQRPGKCLATP